MSTTIRLNTSTVSSRYIQPCDAYQLLLNAKMDHITIINWLHIYTPKLYNRDTCCGEIKVQLSPKTSCLLRRFAFMILFQMNPRLQVTYPEDGDIAEHMQLECRRQAD